MGAFVQKLQSAGFAAVEVVSQAPLSYADLKPYPLYQLGLLDQLFAAISPEWQDRLIGSATIQAVKPPPRHE